MNIPHKRLPYFQVAVEVGSVRRAAARLNVAPSAVSRQLSLIEEAIGAPVLERINTGVQPTEVGLMLLDYCYEHAALDSEFNEKLDAYQRLSIGQITLSIGEGFVGDLIDAPLKRFIERYPGIHLDITTGSTQQIIEAVMTDQSHIGLMYYEPGSPLLRYWRSSIQPLMAVMSPKHILSGELKPLSLEMIAEEPMALWRKGHGVRGLVDHGFREAGMSPVVSMQTNSLSVLKHAAQANVNFTLLPEFAAAQELEDGTLVAKPVACSSFRRANAHIVTRSGRRLPAAGMKLLRHLERWMLAFRPS